MQYLTELVLFMAYCTPIYAVSFVAQRISTLLTSYLLHTMMLFDNCCKNHGGVVTIRPKHNFVSSLSVIFFFILMLVYKLVTTQCCACLSSIFSVFSFYRAMHVVLARYCYRKSSVRL